MVPEEAHVATELSLQTRRALLENDASAYREAPLVKKGSGADGPGFPETAG